MCSTNIYSLAFRISHDGPYARINNFRLGWMPNDTTLEWNEVSGFLLKIKTYEIVTYFQLNAAWGQSVLLLISLARRLELHFRRFEPVAMGTHSYIGVIDDKDKVGLHNALIHSQSEIISRYFEFEICNSLTFLYTGLHISATAALHNIRWQKVYGWTFT